MRTRLGLILLTIGALLLLASLVGACEAANLKPLPTNTALPAKTPAATEPQAPTNTASAVEPPPATQPPEPTAVPTVAPAPGVSIPPVPVGKERRAREWDSDATALLYGRRISSSDLVGGFGGVGFEATDCLRCHENAEGVEGQIFYGPNFTDYNADQWPDMLSDPETGLQPVLDSYDFLETHDPRVALDTGILPEHILRQNP